uniref:ShKT domain-containing protein n=2 Tax=Branchiostoma floridae TaxID=7739 RepID=C3Y6E1_BRAFL|eukprot:XP_002607891.1 hypothetical protein BRAFLDRAFT_74844 [Branchiostoma floridae]
MANVHAKFFSLALIGLCFAGVTGSNCEDTNGDDCAVRIWYGECHNNPTYMNQHCRRSCDLCSHTTVTGAGGGTTAEDGPTAGTTPHASSTTWQGIVTTVASLDNSTMYKKGNTMCYYCEGTSRECMTGNGLGGHVIECQEEEACWVERIGEGFNVSYKRSCKPSCTDFWQYETCMIADEQAKMCKLCCTGDRCNTHILTDHNDPRAPARSGNSGAEGILASLGLVSILAVAMCAEILSLIT